jgi:hypothetical protein
MSNVVVFDLDDTIGHFVQLSGLDWFLTKLYGKIVTREHFNEILDLYPKIFRPRIFKIMNFLKNEKKRRKDVKVMIYTNNTGCKIWVHRIKSYIEKKINYKLFDRVICGWKYDGRIIEPNRTGWDKKYTDLLRCGHLTKKDEILFLDDQYHPDMFHQKVRYLQLKPYVYNYPYKQMIMKYKSIVNLSKKQEFLFKKKIDVTKKMCWKKNVDLKVFKKIGYKIEKQVKYFLSKPKKTRKHTRKRKGITSKKMNKKNTYKKKKNNFFL